jgi:ribosomal protein L40E
MLVICIPAIAYVLWNPRGNPNAYSLAALQIAFLSLGVGVWYFFGEVIIEGATRIYESFRAVDTQKIGAPLPAPADSVRSVVITRSRDRKFCRFCGARIPRESRYCEECGMNLI